MSLEEEQLPPSTRGGGVQTQRGAWVDGSAGSYDDNHIFGGDEYWSREEMSTRSMEDLVQENDKLREQVFALRTQEMKYKHQLDSQEATKEELVTAQRRIEELEQEILSNKQQLESQQMPESQQEPDSCRGNREVAQTELDIAQQRIEELEQEVLLSKYLLDEQSSCDNTDSYSKNGVPQTAVGHRDEELERVKEELERVKAELERVKVEKKDQLEKVKRELDKVKGEKNALESKVQGEHSKIGEDLKQELDRVTRELCDTRTQLQKAQSDLRAKEAEFQNAVSDSSHVEELERQQETAQREMEKVKQMLAGKEQDLMEARSLLENREEELERVKEESKRKATPRRRLESLSHVKLEEAMKKLKEKEEICEQFDARIQKVEEEKSALQVNLGEKLSEMEEQLAEETQRRLEIDSLWTRDKQNLHYELSERSVTVSKWQQEAERYARDLQKKEEIEKELQQVVESGRTKLMAVLGEKEQLIAETQQLAAEKEELAKEKGKIESEKAEVVKQNTAMLATINQVEDDRKVLQTRALNAEEACGGFQEEAEKTIEDYRKLADQLTMLKNENAEIRQKSSKRFSELSKRTEEVQRKDKEMKIKDEQLKKREDDLVRKDVELRNVKETYERKLNAQEEATNMQMEVYREDFAKEREAREKAVGKLGEQHQINAELKKKLESLERYKKELQAQLNQQAARQIQAEYDEDYSNGYHPQSPRDAQGPSPGPRNAHQGPYRAS